MRPYDTIIVGSDGSATATRAVQRAAVIAVDVDADLMVVAAFSRPAGSGELAHQAATGTASDAIAQARRIAPDVRVDTVVPEGDPASVLIETADQRDRPLLVVGNRGMTSSSPFMLGNVPNKLTHHAACDVLVVATEEDRAPVPMTRLLVATDGSGTAGIAVDRAAGLAAALDIEVTILTVADDDARGTATVADAVAAAERAGATARGIVASGDPAGAIIDAAAKFDLLVVGSRGMTGPARFLLGSIPNKVSHHARTDLLIVRTT